MNRRDFLKTGAAALAVAAGNGYFVSAAEPKKPRVGLIGAGWFGKLDLLRLIQVAPVEVVSLCDVDRNMLAKAADVVADRQASKKKPRTYGDYRQMLKDKDLDIVLIGTPDHWHALHMIAAVEAGADVYVQKPISVDVVEGQAMVAAARKHNKVVQVGTQRRSTPHLIDVRDKIIKEGKLGKVAFAEICCYYHMRPSENPKDSAAPDYLDYEMWTGPAPMRPYNNLVHPKRWRAFMEYGNGIVGDMCVHMLDMVRWMLDLGWPKRIASTGGIFVDKNSKANISDTQAATFDFGDMTVVWEHRTWGDAADREFPWSATIYGDKGTLKVDVFKYAFTPLGKNEPTETGQAVVDDKFPEDKTEEGVEPLTASAVRSHMQDFLKAIQTRGKPAADIEEGHISTASCILANLSMQLGRTLTWDPVKKQIVGDDAANKLLRRAYRQPWNHPEA